MRYPPESASAAARYHASEGVPKRRADSSRQLAQRSEGAKVTEGWIHHRGTEDTKGMEELMVVRKWPAIEGHHARRKTDQRRSNQTQIPKLRSRPRLVLLMNTRSILLVLSRLQKLRF